MEKREREVKLRTQFLLGCLLGSAVFLMIYGVNVLDVTNDGWLLLEIDIKQHYIGWLFYRDSPWQFPFGIIEGLTAPEKTSIIFTDSIPIFALFFKLFRNWLPDTFQYFGMYGMLSYALMGGFSNILLRKYFTSGVAFLSSLFFIISPYMLQRMFTHTSLASQWIIIAAFVLWLYNPGKNNFMKKVFLWFALSFVAAGTHLYFIPMLLLILFITCVRDYLEDRKWKREVFLFVGNIGIMLISLVGYGAFLPGGDFASDGLGIYSANLNSLFNPLYGEKIFRSLEHGWGQYEGNGYLGAGIIILLFVALYNVFLFHEQIYAVIKERINVRLGIGACIIFFMVALSPIIMFGEKVLISIPYPNFIMELLSIFRASGRFIWPVCYLIMLSVLCCSFRARNASTVGKIGFLIVVLCVQLVDLSGTIENISAKYIDKKEYNYRLNTCAWDMLLSGKKQIIFFPPEIYGHIWDEVSELAYMAAQKDVDLSSFYLARMDWEGLQNNLEAVKGELEAGIVREDSLYIFEPGTEWHSLKYPLIFYDIDGFVVGVSHEMPELLSIEGVTESVFKIDYAENKYGTAMYGFYGDEGDAAWVERVCGVEVRDETISKRGLTIKFRTMLEWLQLADSAVTPEMRIYVNGVFVGAPLMIEGENEYYISPEMLPYSTSGVYKVVLESNASFMPKEIGLNDDSRELAVQVMYIGGDI